MGDVFTVRPTIADQDFTFSDFILDGDPNSGRGLVTDSNGGAAPRDFTLDNLTVRNFNILAGNGGGIYMVSVTGTVSIEGGAYDNNWAAFNGGAGYFNNIDDLDVSGATVNDNFNGTLSGAGFAVENSGDITVTDSTFSLNDAWGNGGGLWVNDFETVVLQNATFSLNTTNAGNTGNGGGAYFQNGGIGHCDRWRVQDNVSGDGSGGGIYAEAIATAFTVQGSELLQQPCQWQDGGAISVRGTNTVPVQIIGGTRFEENGADDLGGAIYTGVIGTFTTRTRPTWTTTRTTAARSTRGLVHDIPRRAVDHSRTTTRTTGARMPTAARSTSRP